MSYDYIMGNSEMSILSQRYFHLLYLDENKGDLQVACKDPDKGSWSKWETFPGPLFSFRGNTKWDRTAYLEPLYDVHRSVMENEIVIESDYPDYEQNYEAARMIGAILEKKGFIPHYYFSGNKSIHIHVHLDLKRLLDADPLVQDLIVDKYKLKSKFLKAFMKWLREMMISCWGVGARNFDEQLIHATHLIRSEMSKNKLGYKTFISPNYTYKDLSMIPCICNEKNRIYPQIGEVRLSKDYDPGILLEEFLAAEENETRKGRIKRKEASLIKWINPNATERLRTCVKFLLSDDFSTGVDGRKRAMFVLVNELKRILGPAEGLAVLKDWNKRMGFPIKEKEMEYRINLKEYSLSCDYIHGLIKELGFDVSEKCKGKIYK